jgi:hypothetical protein
MCEEKPGGFDSRKDYLQNTFTRRAGGSGGERLQGENVVEMFASTKRRGGRPDLFDIAFLTTRYRSEFAVLEIPVAVQRVVFPVIVALGHLLGRYRRFAGAPLPISR